MTATELFSQLQTLPEPEKAVFSDLFHEWENHGNGITDQPALGNVEWPDFLARMKEDFPHGLPGKPVSEIVDEGRGPRP